MVVLVTDNESGESVSHTLTNCTSEANSLGSYGKETSEDDQSSCEHESVASSVADFPKQSSKKLIEMDRDGDIKPHTGLSQDVQDSRDGLGAVRAAASGSGLETGPGAGTTRASVSDENPGTGVFAGKETRHESGYGIGAGTGVDAQEGTETQQTIGNASVAPGSTLSQANKDTESAKGCLSSSSIGSKVVAAQTSEEKRAVATQSQAKSDTHGARKSSTTNRTIDDGDDDEGVVRDILNGHLDRYGFATTEHATNSSSMSAMSLARDRQTYWSKIETDKQRKQRIRLENLRTQKWLRMIFNWDVQVTKKRQRLNRRIRKGVPDCFRDKAWPLLVQLESSGTPETTKCLGPSSHKDASFEVLLSCANKSDDPEMDKIREVISRDIGRTFPRHIIFHRQGGIGQRSMTNVLRAYAALDMEVGYCQGMGFIVGLLLGYIPEAKAFSIFRTLMLCEPWKMCELYKPGMPGSQLLLCQYEKLLKRFVPDVAEHLEREMIVPSMYATQWFITVFTYNFPFDVVVRVWDIFLTEGWPIVHKVAVAIMKKNKKEILSRKFEHILEYFRGIPPSLNPQEILDLALPLPITPQLLAGLQGY